MQVALMAEFKVPAQDFDRFLAAAQRELRAVRQNEPGCLRFDVIVFDEVEASGAFVEIFASEEAVQEHRELDHVKVFFDEIEHFDVQWTIHHGRAIE